jgi:hypothetical protein
MIRTDPVLIELPGLVEPMALSGRLKPQTPREEGLVDLIESLLDYKDDDCHPEDMQAEELERLSDLELKFIKGNAAFKAGLEELKLLLCQVCTDNEKVSHMTAWMLRQRQVLLDLSPR